VRLPPHVLPNLMRVIKLPRIEVADPNLISLPKSHLEDSTEIDLCGDGRHRPSVERSSAGGVTNNVPVGTLDGFENYSW
jgi:hypothetical protein